MLMAEQQYRAEIARLPRWTERQRQELVEGARKGDTQARDSLILSCVGYVVGVARKYAVICAAAASPIEFLDLVQIGNVTIVERMDKALAHPNPIGYLYKAASGAIIQYCQTRSSLIVTPKDNKGKPLAPMEMQRLDVPTSRNDEEQRLGHEVLSTETRFPKPESEIEGDYRMLYTTVASLPARQQETITRHYGLECVPERLTEIGIHFRLRCGHALPRTYEERQKCDGIARNYLVCGLKNMKKKLERSSSLVPSSDASLHHAVSVVGDS